MTPEPTGPVRLSTLSKALAIGALVLVLAAAATVVALTRQSSGSRVWIGTLLMALAGFLALAGAIVLIRRRLIRIVREARRMVAGGSRGPAADRERGSLGLVAHVVDWLAFRVASLSSELRALKAEKAAILQSIDGGVVILDEQRRIVDLNRSAEMMLNLPATQARGRLLHEVARQPDLHRFVEEAFAGAADSRDDLTLSGQASRRVRAAVSPVVDHEGRPSGLLVVLNDITKLRRLESLRTDFAANVSHELRTPITNIKGYVETLMESSLTDPAQSLRFLGVIARNADRLSAIVEDMLVLTQIERADARENLATSETEIGAVIDLVLAEAEPVARAKGMTILVEAPRELRVLANAPLLQQALGNLLGNALKYSPPESRVWIRAGESSGEGARPFVCIDVVDEGPGIAEEHLARLFERFYRADRARSREQGGTGLGLAIVKHIAEVHSGRVEVSSVLGRGSTFRLSIPAVAPSGSEEGDRRGQPVVAPAEPNLDGI